MLSVLCVLAAQSGQVSVPLDQLEKKKAELEALRAQRAAQTTDVVVGETTYLGRSDGKNLDITLTLSARLAASSAYKTVPIVGSDAVIVSATVGGRPIALDVVGDRWVWTTTRQGPVEVVVKLIVPPRGPRGSLEYRFGVVESPVTQLSAFFPTEGLSPQVSGAVTSQVEAVEGGTQLQAVLRPTRTVHMVGLYDVDKDSSGRKAKVYGETQNLVALTEDSIELFTVVRYTILYAAERRFRIELPAGYEIVSADGQGAFVHRVETVDHKPVLIGESAFGIRDRYEISLRLRRALGAKDSRIRLPTPRLLDVERDTGFVAIEVPGKLSVENVEGDGLIGIDVRELPSAIVDSSVTPVVRAFKYGDARSSSWVSIARYPEAMLSSGGVDHLRAKTVLTADGKAMTEARFTIRNNLHQYLAVQLSEDAQVKSALIDGEPVKPSRDETGRVLIPLVRSARGSDGLIAFTVQMVYAEHGTALGWFGRRALSLPKLDVPVASVSWRVLTPGGYERTDLASDHAPQSFVKNAAWHQDYAMAVGEGDPGDAPDGAVGSGRASGAVPVRVNVPERGHEAGFSSFWVEPERPVMVRFSYARTPLVVAVNGLPWLFGLLGLGLLASRKRNRGWVGRLEGAATSVFGSARSAVVGWWTNEEDSRSRGRRALSAAVRLAVLGILGIWLCGLAISLIDLLGRPL